MKKYLSCKNLIIIFFISYSAIAAYGNVYSPRKEIFPVFSWSLFSYVSDNSKQIELEITEIDHVALDEPTYFYELSREFHAARKRDVTLAKLLQRIAVARRNGDSEATESLRRVLERTYLSDHRQVGYRIVLTRFHPIERWRDGTIRSKHVLGQFEALYE